MFCNQGSLKPAANEAVVHAEDLYRSMLKDTLASDCNSWKIEHYLQKLAENDDCFDYRVARDGETQVPTAVVWQTGTQRSDFATYGCQLGSASQENFLLKGLPPLQDVAFVAVGVALGVIHQLHLAPSIKNLVIVSAQNTKRTLSSKP